MILSGYHVMADLRELWTFKSFRARIFLAAFPTAIAFFFGHLASDRDRPYEFIKEKSYILPPSGRGGDTVTVVWRVNYTRTCPGFVERRLIDPQTDAIIAAYDPSPTANSVTRVNTTDPPITELRKTFALPKVLQKGTIGYKAKLTYHCNWLQAVWPLFAIKYETPTLLFTVEE